MKTKLTTLIFFLSNLLFSQNIKTLSTFYEEDQPTSSNNYTVKTYYKDIENNFTPFIGTWTYQNGTQSFIVNIWKETKKPVIDSDDNSILYYKDMLFGHYKMVENYGISGEIENIIYSSEINFTNSSTPINTVIYGTSLSYGVLGAEIYDINTMSSDKYFGKMGILKMTLSNSIPLTATWLVSETDRMNPQGNFVIPTNIVLTKQP